MSLEETEREEAEREETERIVELQHRILNRLAELGTPIQTQPIGSGDI